MTVKKSNQDLADSTAPGSFIANWVTCSKTLANQVERKFDGYPYSISDISLVEHKKQRRASRNLKNRCKKTVRSHRRHCTDRKRHEGTARRLASAPLGCSSRDAQHQRGRITLGIARERIWQRRGSLCNARKLARGLSPPYLLRLAEDMIKKTVRSQRNSAQLCSPKCTTEAEAWKSQSISQ